MCNCGGGRRRGVAAGGGGLPGRAVGSRMVTAGAMRRAAPPSPRTPPPRMINGIQVRDTAAWGPPLWAVLHGLAEYGAETIPLSDWQALITALQTGLPCPECTAHYQRWCRLHPLTVPRRWLLDLHNEVNRRRRVSAWTEEQLTASFAGVDHIMEAVQMAERVEKLRDLIGPAALEVLVRMAAAVTGPAE
jgi:Erv1 / Alr family